MTDKYADFDELVRRFMRRELTGSEEADLKIDLYQQPQLRQRARTIALMTREMLSLRQERDAEVVEAMGRLTYEQLLATMASDQKMGEFDESVRRFMQSSMSPEEEASFKTLLSSDYELRQRAQTIALMTKKMQRQRAKDEALAVKSIEEAQLTTPDREMVEELTEADCRHTPDVRRLKIHENIVSRQTMPREEEEYGMVAAPAEMPQRKHRGKLTKLWIIIAAIALIIALVVYFCL